MIQLANTIHIHEIKAMWNQNSSRGQHAVYTTQKRHTTSLCAWESIILAYYTINLGLLQDERSCNANSFNVTMGIS